jgi:hypothetical protein
MDYKLFRFKAVVDFIEIEIHTAARANAGKIETKLRLSGVEPIDEGAGNYATTFKIKLHDLKNFAALRSKIARIESAYPLTRAPTVTMIEVAFDGGYKKGTANAGATRADLLTLAARMAHFVANPAGGKKPRLFHDRKQGVDFDMPVTVESLARKMSKGWNVGIGNVESEWTDQTDQYHHGYFKTTDRKSQLPPPLHRARFEIRLAGAALPHQDIEGWQGFKFESLAEHLNWRKEGTAASPLQQLIMDRPGASHRKDCKRHKGTVGGKGGGTRAYIIPADKPLNDIARKCLENLTRGWKKGEKTPQNAGPIVTDLYAVP